MKFKNIIFWFIKRDETVTNSCIVRLQIREAPRPLVYFYKNVM